MRIKYQKVRDDVENPEVIHKNEDAGLDLRAAENYTLQPGESHIFPTGLKVEIPEHSVGLVCPRSGLAIKHNITVLNSPGIIDSGYRGELGVILYNAPIFMNTDKNVYKVEKNDRIAQLLVIPAHNIELSKSDYLSDSKRGEKGFGDTGKK